MLQHVKYLDYETTLEMVQIVEPQVERPQAVHIHADFSVLDVKQCEHLEPKLFDCNMICLRTSREYRFIRNIGRLVITIVRPIRLSGFELKPFATNSRVSKLFIMTALMMWVLVVNRLIFASPV